MIVSTTKTFHITLSEQEAKELISAFDMIRRSMTTLPEPARQLEEAICEHFNV